MSLIRHEKSWRKTAKKEQEQGTRYVADGLNKAMIIGNLSRDPELRKTQTGNSIARLSVATNRTYFNKQTQERIKETEWHKVTVWGKTADNCAEFLKKGSKVFIEGRLRTSSYEKEGVKRYVTEIIADNVTFLDSKSASKQEKSSPASDTEFFDSDDSIPF